MNNPSTVEQLREMRFSAMANEFDAQLKAPATYAQIPFEDRFGLLVKAEWNRRQANKLARRIPDGTTLPRNLICRSGRSPALPYPAYE